MIDETTVAYVCRHCGWELTVHGLWESGGVPYCCGSAERALLEGETE